MNKLALATLWVLASTSVNAQDYKPKILITPTPWLMQSIQMFAQMRVSQCMEWKTVTADELQACSHKWGIEINKIRQWVDEICAKIATEDQQSDCIGYWLEQTLDGIIEGEVEKLKQAKKSTNI